MRPSIIATILSLTVFAGTGFAGDHDGKPEGKGDGKPGNEHHPDGDAKLTEEQKAKIHERIEAMKEKHPELFKKIDKNGDGKISPEEMHDAREILEKHRKDGAEQHRKDGKDGKDK
jgi:Spy/CpxP family protein refolding chaperone